MLPPPNKEVYIRTGDRRSMQAVRQAAAEEEPLAVVGLLRLAAADGINRSALELSEVFVQLQTLVGPSVGVEPNIASQRLALVLFRTNICSVRGSQWLARVPSSIRSIATVRMVKTLGSGMSAALRYLEGNAARMSI